MVIIALFSYHLESVLSDLYKKESLGFLDDREAVPTAFEADVALLDENALRVPDLESGLACRLRVDIHHTLLDEKKGLRLLVRIFESSRHLSYTYLFGSAQDHSILFDGEETIARLLGKLPSVVDGALRAEKFPLVRDDIEIVDVDATRFFDEESELACHNRLESGCVVLSDG